MAADPKAPMAPAMAVLIEELAKRAVRDYLTAKPATDRHSSRSRSNRDGLPDLNEAA
ncbi:hypothetical protein [Luteibacter sp. SG786]|uniref:hypothetical protein n=1 Tax=Luteibacter sp. SG786 TaxID=2587130 RepID=UPI001422EFD4|nr:hypothetical protein [Luteibacter sp. SG786]NII53534.1 hypothetical protein [Luteibacter sp. SG786]